MFKAIKRLITSGLKPHSCKLCNNCYVCHECLRERNQIRQCCFGVTEEELDVLHEELKKNFSLLYPVRKYSIELNANSSQSENVDDAENCCVKSRDRSNFQCNICGKSFKTEFTLTRHFNAHAKVGEKFKCQTCNKCFAINRDLQKHCKTHRNVESKSRICMYCEKEFNSWYYLKIHMRRHTGERPFKCELCNNGFTTQYILNIHYRTHAMEIVNNEHLRNKFADSYLESLEDEDDSFSEQESFSLESIEHEQSNRVISEDQDFISQLSGHFNLEDNFDDDEISQKSISLSLGKSLNLETSSNENISVQKSYKSPLVIKLKPSA
ncbi:unnamed protein product [Larinioides sclopetarius]|uniref:C2H2-type domain-containing protein n=2 Tax=Larinioides sclopetarius TaxID=280406 RepID=A0AAV2B4W0_9ARAC